MGKLKITAEDSPDDLAKRLTVQHGPEGEHPDLPRALWRQEVLEQATQKPYWRWVAAELTSLAR